MQNKGNDGGDGGFSWLVCGWGERCGGRLILKITMSASDNNVRLCVYSVSLQPLLFGNTKYDTWNVSVANWNDDAFPNEWDVLLVDWWLSFLLNSNDKSFRRLFLKKIIPRTFTIQFFVSITKYTLKANASDTGIKCIPNED